MMNYRTLQQILEIETHWSDSRKCFIADAKALPGSPLIGIGETVWQAMFDLLARFIWERAITGNKNCVIDNLLKKELGL